jgi:hybrid cluster-associated redox disulfide protein
MVSMRGLITEGRMTTFTKDMSILEALQADPRAREVFAIHGLACIGCMGAMMESIEDGARMHGIDPVALLRDLNRLASVADRDG